MQSLPRLTDLLDTFALVTDLMDRANLLISYADQFREVPLEIAARPFAKEHQVPYCESEAYAWAILQEDGGLKLYFAVDNPSGVSAKALAAILDSTLSGERPEAFDDIPPDLVERLFRQNISMGKGMGLMAMIQAVQALARRARRT